jgi:hypothetical protein
MCINLAGWDPRQAAGFLGLDIKVANLCGAAGDP